MDTIILAGGYAKRMNPTTNEVPKQLLPVAGKPMLSYVLDSLENLYLKKKGTCYISVNKKHEKDFENFLSYKKPNFSVKLAVEDTNSESQKLGSIGALNEIKVNNSEDILVIGGDNLLSLNILEFLDFYESNNNRSLVALYDIKNKEQSKLYGVVEIDNNSKKILDFEEKPNNPKSTLVSTALYLFKKSDFIRISDYVKQIENKDTLGKYLKWLVEEDNPGINGFVFDGFWFDIGDHSSYEEANKLLRKI